MIRKRNEVNQFGWHVVQASDGGQTVCIRCHRCYTLIRSSGDSGRRVTHCDWTSPRRIAIDHLPVILSKKHVAAIKRIRKNVMRDMAREKADKAAAALLMGTGWKKR